MIWSTVALAGSLQWSGIDYSLVRLIALKDLDTSAFPGLYDAWNARYLQEVQPYMRRRLQVETLTSDLSALRALHRQGPPRIIDTATPEVRPALNEGVIRERIRTLPGGDKAGMIFVADQLNGPTEQACFWVTMYRSHKVLSTDFECAPVGTGSFEDRWFGPVKALAAEVSAPIALAKEEGPGERVITPLERVEIEVGDKAPKNPR